MKKLFSILLAVTMIVSVPYASSAYTREPVIDVNPNGSNVEDTATDLLNAEKTKISFDSVIVVNSDSLDSDGLSASGLIGASNGILYCTKYNDSGSKLNKLLDGDTSKSIYFIGGNQVISQNFKTKFIKQGYDCTTLAGRTRIETSYRVAKEIYKLRGSINSIALTSGFKGVADSISIASAARLNNMPVILTNGKFLQFDTNGIKTYVIGGNKVMSENIANETNAIRIAGSNRYETNRKILEYFGLDNGRYSLCIGNPAESYYGEEYDDLKTSVLLGCCWTADPVVLVSNNSDKTILEGATYLKEFFFPDEILDSNCYNAVFGKDVTNAVNSIFKQLKLKRYNNSFWYCANEGTCMTSKQLNKYKNDYYIFSWIKEEGEVFDADILVRKSDHKIFCFGYDSNRPVPFKNFRF